MIRLKISCFFAFFFLYTLNIDAQEMPSDSLTIFESLNDSLNLSSINIEVTDSLAPLFYAADSAIYATDSVLNNTVSFPSDSIKLAYGGEWSNDILFLFNKNFDPSKMEDTVKIALQDNFGHCFYEPVQGFMTSPFGWRRWQFHYGVDIGLNKGDTVRCAFDGIVRVSKWGWGYGNVIIVRHLNGLETLYGHLSASKVLPNQPVKAGEMLGLGGSTGRSTGPHLHFEVRYHGAPLNPLNLIDFKTGSVLKDTIFISKKSFQYVSDIKKVSGSAKYYKVRSGDTLSKIALKTKSSVATICRLNGLKSSSLLKIGRNLRVR
ncbi:MAG: peptidoglycan DD-metalloendopeptidase family protein [Bacteroidetes bacterium]|nr:peptidoglycan DD-metalloendopeptidase family protein [Bacteroidota bacterium]